MNASRENTPALEVAGLSYSYGRKPALEDVSFTLRGGEFKVLLGPNGAGKTTLFSLITRLFESRDGTIRVDGIGLRRRAGRALQRMGVVFQQPTLDLDLTVRQNLLYHASLHGIAKSEAAERIETELARLEMADRRGETVRRLNGGHRRRVEIARALLHRPMLLLLDEPTVGLDVPTRRAIVEHVHQLCREEGTAVLWATHLIDEVFDDDNVIVLHEGRVRADGGAAAVIAAVAAESIGDAFDRLTNGGSA
ncbi:MAG: ABC transporter ATP-binding protein [Alphaproteobacteria bacterium]